MTAYILSSDLSDGVHQCACIDHDQVISALKDWLAEAAPGEGVEIKCKEMTPEELNKLEEL